MVDSIETSCHTTYLGVKWSQVQILPSRPRFPFLPNYLHAPSRRSRKGWVIGWVLLGIIQCLVVGAVQADIPSSLTEINRALHRNFTADGTRPPGLGGLNQIRTGERPFRGNCVHFALAAYYQLDQAGLEPVLVGLKGRYRGRRFWHLIACSHSSDICLDNDAPRPYPGSEILTRYDEIERVFTLAEDVLALAR